MNDLKGNNSNNKNYINKPTPLKIKPKQIPMKNFGFFSIFSSNSNSFRQGILKTSTKKGSPDKNNYINSINIIHNNEDLITEGKELEDNTLELIKKKFIKKKNSNFLNFTNPISNKLYGSRHENIIKTHAPNSNSTSINTSLLQNNTRIEDKSRTLNHSLNKIAFSPREDALKKIINTNYYKLINKPRLGSGMHEKKISMKIFNKVVMNLNKNKKDINLNFIHFQKKRSAQTTLNSRKNSNEKRFSRLINHKKGNKINFYNNTKSDYKNPIIKKYYSQQNKNNSMNSNLINNNSVSLNNSSDKKDILEEKKNTYSEKVLNQKNFFPFTAPLTKHNSKTNSKQKNKHNNSNREKNNKLISKLEKLGLNIKKNNYLSNPQNNIIYKEHKESSLQKKKSSDLKNFIYKKNLSTINRLLSDFKNDLNNNKLYLKDKNKSKKKEKKKKIKSKNERIENQIKKEKSKHNRNQEQNTYLNNSNTSMFSTMKDSNYYLREYELLSKYIKEYYNKNKEYPKTDLSFYKFGRIIGKGAFGKVNLGLNILTGRVVAIKSFNKENINNEISKEKILYETNLMRKLHHSSITKILETFETEKYILIIMEYISGGNLQSFVKKRRKLGEKTAKILFKQIIEGIKYIHSQNIVHRDIKLENILIDLNNNIKICDFGVGKLINSNLLLHEQCGTPVYMAPEIIKGEGYFGFPVDIWSSGIALYIMLSGNIPFNKSKVHDLQYNILNTPLNPIKSCSDEANDLLKGLLDKNPFTRLTHDDILNHPWLKLDDNIDINDLNINKYHLFTNAEMILLSKTHIDYRKAPKGELGENFTLRNLFTIDDKNNINKNVETKSIILAPYNTIISDDDEYDYDYSDDIDYINPELITQNGIINFCGKVREFNINYELNNNEEIDNGMLINSKVDIITEEINNSNNSIGGNNIYMSNNNIGVNKITRGNLLSINDYFVKKVEELGYDRDYIIKCLEKNELNSATTAYYLFSIYENIKS